MNKRIILVGPTASGKNVLRDRFSEKGFTYDVSYTTRDIRNAVGEKNGVDYHFITDDEFLKMEQDNKFYEKVYYNGKKYGTGRFEWEKKDIFIMEPDGVGCILKEDRETCFIIYLEPPVGDRVQRMRNERKWDEEQISDRLKTDMVKFSNFNEYDIKITNPKF